MSSTSGKFAAQLEEKTPPELTLPEPRASLFHPLSWRNFGPARLRLRERKKAAANEEYNVTDPSPGAPDGGGPVNGRAEDPSKKSRQGFGGRRIRFGKGPKDYGSATEVPSPTREEEEVSPAARSNAAVKINLLLAPPRIWANEYPAGKAIRVDTPPLKEDTADGKPRGLFFDVSGPSDAGLNDSGAGGSESTSTRASKKETHKNEAQGLSEPKRRREWWDPYPKTLAAATTTAASRRDLIRKAAAFEFDVPEHLPNSPMCPANPKHKSGGKGVCVYHGRRKSSYRERGSAGNSLRHSPRNSPGTQVQKRRSSGGSSPSVVVIRPVRSGGHSDGVGDKGESQDGLFVSTGADDRELL